MPSENEQEQVEHHSYGSGHPMPFALAMPSSSEQQSLVQSTPLLDEVRIYSWAGMSWKMSPGAAVCQG